MATNLSIMDVDPPVNLKRSNSAPMINDLNSNMAEVSSSSSPATVRDATIFNVFSSAQPRTRRFSGSFSTHHSAGGSPRPSPRVSQLRQEECLDIARSEAAHEKEIHSAIQMSQSCEDLTLVTEGLSCSESDSDRSMDKRVLVPRMDTLHLTMPPNSPVCSSPSPTRSSGPGRQCFTPGMYSPTRKAYATRRSQSPIAMRPSPLGPAVKRKFELDEMDKSDMYRSPPAKRMSGGFGDSRSSGNGSTHGNGGLLMAQHRLEQGSSPLPGSLSSVGTPDSMSSADSPNFTFGSVDSPSSGGTLSHAGATEPNPS